MSPKLSRTDDIPKQPLSKAHSPIELHPPVLFTAKCLDFLSFEDDLSDGRACSLHLNYTF
jgi:hypothetical protein